MKKTNKPKTVKVPELHPVQISFDGRAILERLKTLSFMQVCRWVAGDSLKIQYAHEIVSMIRDANTPPHEKKKGKK